jgi:hypothetical protein
MRPNVRAGFWIAVILGTLPATGQVAITPVISGNDVTARIDLPGGIGADLTVSFEQAVGLNVTSIAITAGTVNPLDPGLLNRLPASLVSLDSAFPVLVHVGPTTQSTLSFSGVYRLTIRTNNLVYQANSVYRLYRASDGGPFKDITGSVEMGSVRAGGSGPGFSDFLIVADTRPIDSVISQKLDALHTALSGNASAIAPSVYADLSSRLSNIGSLISTGAYASAVDALTAFGTQVKSQSGASIPDVWQANSTVVNVAGTLRSAADTLRYTLVVKTNSGG